MKFGGLDVVVGFFVFVVFFLPLIKGLVFVWLKMIKVGESWKVMPNPRVLA